MRLLTIEKFESTVTNFYVDVISHICSEREQICALNINSYAY